MMKLGFCNLEDERMSRHTDEMKDERFEEVLLVRKTRLPSVF